MVPLDVNAALTFDTERPQRAVGVFYLDVHVAVVSVGRRLRHCQIEISIAIQGKKTMNYYYSHFIQALLPLLPPAINMSW